MDRDTISPEQLQTLRATARQRLNASWKTVSPAIDKVDTMSYGNELLQYVAPEGTEITRHRRERGEFGAFLEKAIQLKVDLKSVSH
ncbi:hypothetical protein BSKO_02087 [Bryopsis sp. KO-2023]|nr:hypothetical protein BSKO_02087 [Bryopsis sp. KO-2023]